MIFPVPYVLILLMAVACTSSPSPPPVQIAPAERMHGLSFVSPARPPAENPFGTATAIGSNWVAIIPYAFSRPGVAAVYYDQPWQWWGERPAGTAQFIGWAKAAGLRVMLKPQVWVMGAGWTGDFAPADSAQWPAWEAQYRHYLLTMAHLADSLDVELLCIGTEYRAAVRARPAFWHGLIGELRTRYGGALTYAANWDEYAEVPFWDALDYVGVNAYFPLDTTATPTVAALAAAWLPISARLDSLHRQTGKPILFTEYGYRSVARAAGAQWEIPDSRVHGGAPNFEAQSHALEAFYRTYWPQPWVAGGFLWKWYGSPAQAHPTDYSPEGKPAQDVVRHFYRADTLE